ncbi:MAG: sodium-dependent transporter [Acidiferrobacterales bacterium]
MIHYRRHTDGFNSEHWSSETVLVMAVSGAAIGLNNFWYFPYLVAQNGGSAFLLVYAAALLLIGVPLLMAEMMIGRRGEYSPIGAVNRLVVEDAGKPPWKVIGWIVTITGFLIFTYLSVVGSWMMAYALRAAVGAFAELSMDGVVGLFFVMAGDPEKQLFWHAGFVAIAVFFVYRGISYGIEPLVRWGLPIVVGLLVFIAFYAAIAGEFNQAMTTMFQFDYERLTIRGVVIAMGQVLFSLGLGVGAVMAYGAYAKTNVSIARVSVLVVLIDAGVGIVAGIFILSVLYVTGQEPVSGPLLLFQGIPYSLARLPGGMILGPLFYLVLTLAALLSAVALIEPAVEWLREQRSITRPQAAMFTGLAGWLVGVVFILSFSYWSFPFTLFGLEKKLGIFDVVQMLASNLLLPAGAILTALLAGWVLNRVLTKGELGLSGSIVFPLWLRTVRVLVPALLLIVAIASPGLYQ